MTRAQKAIEFTDEQSLLLESARSFCRDRSPVTEVRRRAASEFDAALWSEIVDLGWPGIAIPEAYGGSGLGFGSIVPVIEAMGRHLLSMPLVSTSLAARLLCRVGTASQKEQWLPRIASGTIASIALLDDEDWGNTTSRCRAELRDTEIMLSGSKPYVPDAAVAELILAVVSLQGAPAIAVIPRERIPDSALRAHTLVDETRRAATLTLDGISVSTDALIAGDGVVDGLRDFLLCGALLIAAEATGGAAAALDLIVDYLKTRKQFGKLIGSYQALKHPAVDILGQMESARSLVYHAATLLGDGSPDRETEIACRMAKAQASEALCLGGDRAVQFHGGMGFTYDCDAQLYIRRAQWAQQQFGDAQHHRKRLAALLLGA